MKFIFRLLVLFLLYCHYGHTQELTKKHTVKKGETIYQISRIYNVSPTEIMKLNSGSGDLIYVGDILIIPNASQNDNDPNNVSNLASSNNSNILTYTVKPGETKYGISKQFGVTIKDLETQNPQIKNGLLSGHVLKIKNAKNITINKTSNVVKRNLQDIGKTHLVQKGETLYGISKANGLTVNELKETNKDVLTGVLKTGTLLSIPQVANELVNSNQQTYLVKKGDTKYGISKRFNLSIKDLERANPQIVNMLKYGFTINIPSPSTVDTQIITLDEPKQEIIQNIETPISKETIQQQEYIMYVVKTQETLYGLSKKAGMTIPEFLKLNPQLSESVKIGTVIKMPAIQVNQNIVDAIINPLTDTSVGEYKDLRLSTNKENSKKVLIIMPFTDNQLSSLKNNTINTTTISKQDIELYRGMSTAIDSLKTLGLDFDISELTLDSSNINSQTNLEYYDVILNPFLTNATGIVTFDSKKDIPFVTANPISNNNNSKITVYNAVPSIEMQKKKVLDYLNSKNANIIVLSDINRVDSRNFIESYCPNANIIEVKRNGVFKESNLLSKLDKTKMNYIIIDSEKNSVFLSSTNLLLKHHSNYKIQLAVLESSLIPNEEEISAIRFNILNLLYPSINQTSNNLQTIQYLSSYKNKYLTNATENVFLAFDITFDTLLRIVQDISFEQSVKNDKTGYLSLKFDYKKNETNDYNNNEILILEYKNN